MPSSAGKTMAGVYRREVKSRGSGAPPPTSCMILSQFLNSVPQFQIL